MTAWSCGLRVRARLRLTAKGSRRGPVNERATTRNYGIAREGKHTAHGPGRGNAAGQRSESSYLAKVGVAGFESRRPLQRSCRSGPVRAGPSSCPGSSGARGSRLGPVSYAASSRGWGEENQGRAAQCRVSRCASAIVVSAQGSLMPSTTKSPTRSSLRRSEWHRRDRRRAGVRR